MSKPRIAERLPAVLELEPPTRVSAIAGHLDVAKASVTQALQRLTEKGLVESARYGRVSLTAAGLKAAQKIRAQWRQGNAEQFVKTIKFLTF